MVIVICLRLIQLWHVVTDPFIRTVINEWPITPSQTNRKWMVLIRHHLIYTWCHSWSLRLHSLLQHNFIHFGQFQLQKAFNFSICITTFSFEWNLGQTNMLHWKSEACNPAYMTYFYSFILMPKPLIPACPTAVNASAVGIKWEIFEL